MVELMWTAPAEGTGTILFRCYLVVKLLYFNFVLIDMQWSIFVQYIGPIKLQPQLMKVNAIILYDIHNLIVCILTVPITFKQQCHTVNFD